MNGRLWNALLLAAPLVVVGVQIALYRPLLPDQVPSHFDLAGNADDWSDRDTFLLLYSGLVVGMTAMFAFLIWVIPRTPRDLINLPNRDHWLAEERRDETFAFLTRNLLGYHVLTGLLFAFLMHQTYLAALEPEGVQRISIGAAVFGYLIGTGILLVALLRRFRVSA